MAPVFKKGKRYRPENYQSICILRSLSISSSVPSWIMQRNIEYCPEQHGFRQGRSYESQLLGLVDEPSEAVKKLCLEDLIFTDFSKTFDKVSHSLLVHEIHYYGITGKVNVSIDDIITGKVNAWIEGIITGKVNARIDTCSRPIFPETHQNEIFEKTCSRVRDGLGYYREYVSITRHYACG